ncbi:chromatin assembly factor 1 subunit A-domain-containing protein [Cyathus striatus]|nr:chromatin assembly factor 1 subunit A-domain-containing protein [Cyathus striatus]
MKVPLLEMSGAPSTSKEKHDKVSLVEIKNGKVIFRQKPSTFEKQSETLQELVKFREMLEGRLSLSPVPLDHIPDSYRPLIAKLAHESDKTLNALSKHILHELIPLDDDDVENGNPSAVAILPQYVVEASIKSILNRNNYGLDVAHGVKAPASLSVWRWEVREECRDWLPKSAREKADARQAERLQAKEDLKAMFDALASHEKEAIIGSKPCGKQISIGTQDTDPDETRTKFIDLTANSFITEKRNDQDDTAESTKSGRPRRIQDPEKASKEKERLGKKAAKAEKEKKEKDAQDKSRTLMANFFSKAKTRGPPKEEEPVCAVSKSQTDFEKVFKPFVLKKDATLAPVNRFLIPSKRKRVPTTHAIQIDDDDDSDIIIYNPEPETLQISYQKVSGVICSAAASNSLSRERRRRNYNNLHMKTHWPISVRDIMNQLSEAEVAGDDSAVRSLLSKLCDRQLLPAKVFMFIEDARPGYFGTWTRSSRLIGPRTPFAKDVLVFDYGYDSGEEWEEEPAGDADDVVDDGEDEEIDEDVDSDLENWLVDDDEEPDALEAMALQAKDPNLSPPFIDIPTSRTKRKAGESEIQASKKRKIVIPLVPFSKGPCWESNIGACDYEPFKPYRIKLFNDTKFPINPFKFVSTCLEDKRASERSAASSSQKEEVFAVPSLPERLISGSSTPIIGNTTPPSKPASARIPPFPDAHLPFLVKRIAELQASSFMLLVEALYQELKSHKVKKKAIEAKVREIGERCKEKKVWIVKPTTHV